MLHKQETIFIFFSIIVSLGCHLPLKCHFPPEIHSHNNVLIIPELTLVIRSFSSFNFISIHPLVLTVVLLGSVRRDKGYLNSCDCMAKTQQETYVVPYHIRLHHWQPQFNFIIYKKYGGGN